MQNTDCLFLLGPTGPWRGPAAAAEAAGAAATAGGAADETLLQ